MWIRYNVDEVTSVKPVNYNVSLVKFVNFTEVIIKSVNCNEINDKPVTVNEVIVKSVHCKWVLLNLLLFLCYMFNALSGKVLLNLLIVMESC